MLLLVYLTMSLEGVLMPIIKKASKFILFTFIIALLLIPFTSITAQAAEGDLLYIVIEMQEIYEYDALPVAPEDIKYYKDSEHTETAVPDPDDIEIKYYNISDPLNPVEIGEDAPKDAGQYRIVVNYQDEALPPDYDDASVSHDYEITPTTLEIIPRAGQGKVYGNPDGEIIYDFGAGSVYLDREEGLDLLNDEGKKDAIFSSKTITREAGNTVDIYEIIQGDLELRLPYSNNYVIDFVEGVNYEIEPATLTFDTLEVLDKIYDTTTDGEIDPDYELDGIIPGDDVDVDFSNATVTFATANAGVTTAVIGNYQLIGEDAFNYTIATEYTDTDVEIFVRVLDISAIAGGRVYTPQPGDETLDYAFDEAEDLDILKIEFNEQDEAAIKSQLGALSRDPGDDADSYNIIQGGLTAPSANYSIDFTTAIYTISPYVVDVTVIAANKIYGEDDPELNSDIASLPPEYSAHTVSVVLGRTAGSDIGSYDIILNSYDVTGTLKANYSINLLGGDDAFTIEIREISVKADDLSSVYGDPTVALTYTVTVGSLADGDSFTGDLERENDIIFDAGEYAINKGDFDIEADVRDNYSLTFIPGVYTIEKKSVDVRVDPAAYPDKLRKSYGASDPEIPYILESELLTGHINGGYLGREEGEFAGDYDLNCDLIVISDAWDNDVTNNYEFILDTVNYIEGGNYRFEIFRDIIYIDIVIPPESFFNGEPVEAIPMFYDDPDHENIVLGCDYELFYYEGDESDYLSHTPYTPGIYRVEVIFYGSLNYLPQTAETTYEIKRAPLTITGISVRNKIYDTTITGQIAGEPGLNGDIYDPDKITLVTSGATAQFTDPNVDYLDGVVQAKAVSVTGYALTGEHADYYEIIEPISLTAKINPANLDIAAKEVTREYNPLKPDGALDFDINSAINLLSIEFGTSNISVIKSNFIGALLREAGSSVGAYTINRGDLSLPDEINGNPLAGNYNIRFTSATFTITSINLIITVTPGQTKVYGEADPNSIEYTYDAEKILSGDRIVGSLQRASGQNAGSYNISRGTLSIENSMGVDVGDSGLGNYKLTIVNSPFIITKRPITLRASNITVRFGDPDATLVDNIYSGSLAYEDKLTGSIVREPGVNAGEYLITRGTRSITNAGNYSITFINGLYTINPKIILVSVAQSAVLNNKLSKYYGDDDPIIEFEVNSATPLIEGHTISGSLGRAPGENASNYALNTDRIIVTDINGVDVTHNYAFNLNAGEHVFRINKRQLKVYPEPIVVEKGKSYRVKMKFDGFVKGETKDDLDVVFTYIAPDPDSLVEGNENIITVISQSRSGGTSNQDKNYSLNIESGRITCVYPENVPVIAELDRSSGEYKKYANVFSGFTYYKGLMLLDIDTQSGEDPSRTNVMVNIELPEEIANTRKLSVLYLSGNKVSVITCNIEDGEAVFIMNGRGIYLMAKPISGFLIIILPVLGLALIAAGAVFLIRYLRKKKIKKFKPSEKKARAEGGIQDEIYGLKRDFTDEGFDAIIDTGEPKPETDEIQDSTEPKDKKQSKEQKKLAKKKAKLEEHAKDVIVMDDIELEEKKEKAEDFIIKPHEPVKPKSAQKDSIEEEEFLNILGSKKTKAEEVKASKTDEQEIKIKEEPALEDKKEPEVKESIKKSDKGSGLDDIIEELNKESAKKTQPTAVFEDVKSEFAELTGEDNVDAEDDDDDDDIIAPAFKKNRKNEKLSKDLKPMVEKKEEVKKVSMTKAVPSAAPKKTDIEKPKDITQEFGNLGEINNIKAEKKSTEGKIVKQGGVRRFDDDDK